MKSNINNKYVIPNLPGADPRLLRVLQDLADRTNYLTAEMERVRGEAGDVTGLAKRQNPVAGILRLPSPAGDGFIRVSQDGVIHSYASPVAPAGVPRNVYYRQQVVNSVGSSPSTLHEFSVKGSDFPVTDSFLRFTFAGGGANNSNDKQVIFSLAGSVVHATGTLDIAEPRWRIEGTAVRVSNTVVYVNCYVIIGQAYVTDDLVLAGALNGGFVTVRETTVIAPDLTTNPLEFQIQGQGTSNNDVYQRLSVVDAITPMPNDAN